MISLACWERFDYMTARDGRTAFLECFGPFFFGASRVGHCSGPF